MSSQPLSLLIRSILIGWAGFWSLFVLASEMHQADSLLLKALICTGGVLFFLVSAYLGTARPNIGGVVLFSEGIALLLLNLAFWHNPPATALFVVVTLALPPLLVGRLLLSGNDQRRFV